MTDEGHKETDKLLEKLEQLIKKAFAEALIEIKEDVKAYFDLFKKRDKEQRELLDMGMISEAYYKSWLLNQIGRGEHYEAMRDAVAERLTITNEVAAAYMNDILPSVYAINRNYTAYSIDKLTGGRYTLDHGLSMGIDFTLWDEHTVKRLIKERPDLMPYYPEERAVKRGFDLAFGKSQITKQVTSSVLAGHTVTEIADRLQDRIVTMERASAVRAARTAVTNAQNAGRQDCYEDAAKMGITVQKRWIATKDERTRPAHGAADGQTVPYNEPFDVGGEKLMFPGDGSGSPGNIYNCRCTTRTVEEEGIEAEPRYMRVRDENGQNVIVPEMTYSEWKDWIESRRPKTDTEDGKKKTASKSKTKGKTKSKQGSDKKKRSADNSAVSKNKTAKSGLKKTSESVKIKKDKELSDSSSPFVHVGEKAIKRVPKLDVFGDEDMNLKYRKANRDLLREVRDKSKQYPVGTEFSIVYGANMNPISGYGYKIGSVGRVKIDSPEQLYHAFHNHGSGSVLSILDILQFCADDNQMSISAVGNNGNVSCLFVTVDTTATARQDFENYLTDKVKETIFSSNGHNYTLKDLNELARKDEKIEGLSDEQQSELLKAMTKAFYEIVDTAKGDEYGFGYVEHKEWQ